MVLLVFKQARQLVALEIRLQTGRGEDANAAVVPPQRIVG
jgi:hypothetical protein